MSLKIVVLAKQVPDTRNVGKDAMKADGTINRAALPAIFNPEDLNALEQALRLKDEHPGSTVTILTMGPGRAAEVIREGLYRGADNGYLLTDRAFAGADTLATSYALATAIKKIGDYDVIIGGRQAIDGDTAQVQRLTTILAIPVGRRYRPSRPAGCRKAGADASDLRRRDSERGQSRQENYRETSYRRGCGNR